MHPEAEIQSLRQENAAFQQENALLKEELAELRRMLFGSKRERFVSNKKDSAQLELPLDMDVPVEDPPKVKQTIVYQRALKSKSRPTGRKPLPEDLPREEVVLEPAVDTSDMRKVGEEVTEELDLVPAKLFVRRYIRPRYVDKEEMFHIAELPARPIEKGIPGPGLLAQILVDKFCHHLPFYRQVQKYIQWGAKIATSTLGGWLAPACELLSPLYLAHRHQVLKDNYLQVDETPLKVLDEHKKGKTHIGQHWVYYSPKQKLVFFDYQKGRSREGPKQILDGFEGHLQADAFSVYESLVKKEGLNVILAGCMAHSRRHFEHALESSPEIAEKALLLFQQLYAIERRAREQGMDHLQRQKLRLEGSLPIMEILGEWLQDIYPSLLPKSKIAKAAAYFLKNYEKLSVFMDEGHIEIDNNLVENSIRPVAIGRKNYLFAGSHDAAQRAAMIYSLIGTCKLHDINPYDYLKDILERLPEHPIDKIEDLLPQNWKKN